MGGDKTRRIDEAEAAERGIFTGHSEMPNGEVRFRLRSRDGTAYIRTEAVTAPISETEGWQSSHLHKAVQETYIVQTGRMALVEIVEPGQVRTRIFSAGGIVTTQPGVAHNVFLFPGAVIHTVKHGEDGDLQDKHDTPALDEITRHLTIAEIIALDGTLRPLSNLSKPDQNPAE